MKNLKEYIIESQNFLVNKKLNNRQNKYEYHPTNRDELKDIIIDLLKQGETDLNCIDVSNITDMGPVFSEINHKITVKDIDMSEWDVSNVTKMDYMFYNCNEFNSDLSEWDVSNVTDMRGMFKGCEKLDCDLSDWDVSKVEYTDRMFGGCNILIKNNKIPDWYTN